MIIRINSTILTPTEKGQKKLDELNSKSYGQKVDENGRSAEWYENLGMSVPEELIESEPEDMEVYLTLKDGELSTSYSDTCFNTDYLIAIVDNQDQGSTVYLDGDIEILAKETEAEINELIKKAEYRKLNNK